MSNWKPAESLDGVREEIRNAIFQVGFFQLGACMYSPEAAKQKDMIQQKLCFLVEVGVRSGMLSPDEGNDWFDGIWGRKPFGIVVNKWMSDNPEAAKAAAEILSCPEVPKS